MSYRNLEINTATVEIKVIRVDGHKMTKSTFRQIEQDTKDKLSVNNLLGYVYDDGGIVIVWGNNGKIKKRRISGSGYITYDLDGKVCEYGKYESIVCFIKENCDQLFIAT